MITRLLRPIDANQQQLIARSDYCVVNSWRLMGLVETSRAKSWLWLDQPKPSRMVAPLWNQQSDKLEELLLSSLDQAKEKVQALIG